MTPSRRAILAGIVGAGCHPTADEVYEMVRRALPRVSLGTVYRNLELLTRRGLIRTLAYGRGQRRYDAVLEDHCHVRCEACGCVDDVRVTPPGRLVDAVEDDGGYDIHGYRLSFRGLCPDCASKRERCAPGRQVEGGDDESQGNED
jgi:Fe2+ or Zn2+ uptake regulation protein